MRLRYLLFGLNISITPTDILGKTTVPPHNLVRAHEQLATDIGQGVILSTCNRTEVYTLDDGDGPTEGRIAGFLSSLAGSDVIPHSFVLRGREAAYHLFRVTAGLESLAVGETQAAGQVSRALHAAAEAFSLERPLSRLFHGSLRTARRVHFKTDLGRRRISVSSLGVNVLEGQGRVNSANVLLVGAGDTGRLAALQLKRLGAETITVASRRQHKAESLALELGGSFVGFDNLEAALSNADILVCCTASSVPVIRKSDVVKALSSPKGGDRRNIRILDLGMPKDVADDVADVPGATVTSLEDLQYASEKNRTPDPSAVEAAEKMVSDGFRIFAEGLLAEERMPAIRAITEKAEVVRIKELETTLAHLQHLKDAEKERINAMTKSIVKKLLADPIAFVRNAEDSEAVAAVSDILIRGSGK